MFKKQNNIFFTRLVIGFCLEGMGGCAVFDIVD